MAGEVHKNGEDNTNPDLDGNNRDRRSGLTSSDSGYSTNKNYLRIVKAIYPFKGANNDELCFQKDDLIILTQTPEGGWFEGTHLAKRITGWFPAGYVTPLHPDHAHSLLDQQFIDTFNKDNNLQSNRNSVFSDLIETERNYVAELQNILQTYLVILQKSQILPREETEITVNYYREVINAHRNFLSSLETIRSDNGKDARIGGVFMHHASVIKDVHFNYCSIHPKFVHLIEQQRDKVCLSLKDNLGNDSDSPGDYLILLTTGLSLTFRHLDKYPSYLQELQRYTNDAHPDRGDIQRAGFVFRELVSTCLQLRRQKEMELEVMLGNVRNWPTTAEPIQSLGSVCHMGPVSVLQAPQLSEGVKKDRHLVLFPSCLVLLSVSDEMTSFVYEDKISLINVTLPRLPDIQSTKTVFQLLVADPGSEETGRYVLMCPNPEDIRQWISMMHKCKSKLESKSLETQIKEPVRASPSHQASTQASESPIASSLYDNNRSKYWAWKSLLPHPPIRISASSSDLDPSSTSTLDYRDSRHKPTIGSGAIANNGNAKQVNDMAILQVIEAYCQGNRPRNPNASQIFLNQEEKVAQEKATNDTLSEGNSLVETVSRLQQEIKQMKGDMEAITECLRKERQSRKKLAAKVETLRAVICK